jgi:hypothetical protein
VRDNDDDIERGLRRQNINDSMERERPLNVLSGLSPIDSKEWFPSNHWIILIQRFEFFLSLTHSIIKLCLPLRDCMMCLHFNNMIY